MSRMSKEPGSKTTTLTASVTPLTEREFQSYVVEYNKSTVAYPQDKTIVELFEAQVLRAPNDEAVRLGNRSLSYTQLNERANQMAAHLRTLGSGPERLVMLYMEHSLEVVCAILGVLKSGAAYVPVDPASTPKERLTFLLQDIAEGTAAGGALPVLITHSGMANDLRRDVAEVVTLDSDFSQIDRYPTANPKAAASPSNLAYVIYTSGSTGKPKGVLIGHRSLVNYICWANHTYAQGERLAWPLFSSLAFDLTVTSIFTPLISGGRIVVYREDPGVHGLVILKVVADRAADIVKLTPSHLAMIRDLDLGATRIRKLIVGGEDFKTELALDIARKFGRRVEIYNEYGPTEATVGCMIHLFDAENDRGLSVPIGVPAANSAVFILDDQLKHVPTGVTGEMYLAGDGLARGYLNRPELTEQKFLTAEDPRHIGTEIRSSRSKPQSLRLYKTGDIARWNSDGRMEFLGRADFQVKIGGMRIELGEIEARLRSLSGVRECVVDVVHSSTENAPKDETGIDRLAAYYVSEKPLAVAEVREHLAKELPDYMVPTYVIWLEKLPLTTNGKIDRKALPKPAQENAQQPAGDFVRPQTETEKALALIWAELLKVDSIGIDNDFFDLGGHSLLAIRAVSRIRDVFGVEVTFQTLFENPTIAGLSKVITAAKSSGPTSSENIRPIERRQASGPAPLSFAQEQLWFLNHLAPDSPVYNINDAVDFHGEYNSDAMRKAVQELVRRHEILRTEFSHSGGQPVQTVLPEMNVALAELDLGSLPPQEREREWARVVREQGRKPFDLSKAPLLRATAVHLSDHEHRLLVTIHHILADEWSMEVFHQELTRLYDAFSTGRPSPLPELPIQFADFACWQREWLKGEVLESQTSYWKKELAGAPSILEMPTDKTRPASQSFHGATESFQLSGKLLDELKTLGREQQATMFMILEAAFMALLRRYTGQDDIVVGTPISARTHSETENLIGLFLNTVLLRAKFSERPNFLSLVQQVRDRVLGAYAHPDLPFERLVAELAPDRDPSRMPLFQVMFVLHNPEGVSEVSQVSGNRDLGTGTSKFDLTLLLSETEDGLEGMIEYNTDLFEASTIQRICGHYRTLLEASVAQPDRSITELPMLTDQERRQLLVDWNNTAVEVPGKTLCLHQMIEEQAARTPDQVALVFDQQRLTYGELNRRANQLAHYLQELAVGPDTLVGLFMERSLEMIVGLLGILKAGGAYVPMDPTYPKERIAYILEDSKVPIVLTQKSLVNELPNFVGQAICLDSGWTQIANHPQENPSSPVKPENLAYTLFTSGSTGRPKGVALEHRSAVAFIHWANRVFTPKQLEGVLFATSICFDLSVFEMFVPLSVGGKIVIVPNVLHLRNLSAKDGITLINTVPSAIAELLRMGCVPDSVKTINLAGEALSGSLVDQIYETTNVDYVYNLYGPTETTTYSTCTLLPSGCPVTIGKPIANTQAYILDANRNLVPIGVTGELYLAGAGLARGYYGRPDLTNERFVPNPFSGQSGARMYRTGDICNWLSDGNIRYVGRADYQVKLRGFRIELGEIEAALKQQPGVEQAVVVAREDKQVGKILVAYFVAKAGKSAQSEMLRGALQATLPNYMVPSHFVLLDRLPLNANGKIDRNALPPISLANDIPAGAGEEPRGEFEQLLAKAWAEALGLNRICRHDNFFSLGGHSLTALKIAFNCQQEFNVNFPLQLFVQFPVLSEQAKRLEEMIVEQADEGLLESLLAEVIQNRDGSLAGQVETNPVNWPQIEVKEAHDPGK